MSTDLSQQIETAASSAKSTSLDGVTVSEQDVASIIMADKYLAAKNAVKGKHRGVGFNKLVPPGTAGT